MFVADLLCDFIDVAHPHPTLPGAGRIFLGGGGEGDQGSGLAGQADVVGVVLFFDAFCDVLQGGDVVELGVGWPDYFADAAALRVAHAG